MKTFILIALIIVIDGSQASEECNDGYASDHKTAFVDVYGENWHEVHNWKYCDMTCGEMAAAGYCSWPWKSFYCSAIDNLLVQDTCKHSCERCPIDCKWGEWEILGECSKTCGGGTQKQRRDKLVFEKNGGTCSDTHPDQMESVACNSEPCCEKGTALKAMKIDRSTPSGWNKAATEIQYGKEGLVGHYWAALKVQFDFGYKPVEITGVRCDYSNNPYTIKVGDDYEQEIFTSKGNGNFQSLDESITVQKIQVEWSNTKGSNGIHFEFLGCPSSKDVQPSTPDANCDATKPKYIGCYSDDGNRDLEKGPMKYGYNQKTCNEACKTYKYFALQNNGWCVCGDAYATEAQYVQKPEGECYGGIAQWGGNSSPNGNGNGGAWRNSVYHTCQE